MNLAFAAKFLGALFAIMNPFVSLPVFLALTSDQTAVEQRASAVKVSLYAGAMCLVTSLGGSAIIAFFGITIDSFRVAGGIVLLGIALAMLNGQPITSHERGEREKKAHAAAADDDDGVAFYPMTFPMVVGPGTIATLLIYSAQTHGRAEIVSFGVVLLAMLILLFLVLYFAASIGELLTVKMRVIMTRLMGMLLGAIAVEMIVGGIKAMLPGLA